ncbi:MAG: DUF1150 family protein [Phyllobacterium sp.]
MAQSTQKNVFTDIEFAHLGAGQIGYIRKMNTDDLSKNFPALPPMAPGFDLWVLFAANGEPILLSDEQDKVSDSASEHDLKTVALQ